MKAVSVGWSETVRPHIQDKIARLIFWIQPGDECFQLRMISPLQWWRRQRLFYRVKTA